MAREGREARQDHALVLLLQALPDERLDRILAALGVPTEKVEPRVDRRRCTVCGYGYFRCRAMNDRAPEADRHAWSSDR